MEYCSKVVEFQCQKLLLDNSAVRVILNYSFILPCISEWVYQFCVHLISPWQ